jgi:hypothetical protein
MASFNRAQQVILAVTPKISSCLSLLGSSWIFVEVITTTSKRRNLYNRLLCVMSGFDIITGIWLFASTWPIPRGTHNVSFSVGTQTTCTIQGFFVQMAIVVPIYNCYLALYYLLVIKYKVSEERIKFVIEPVMHIFAVCFGLMTAIASVIMGLYNNANLWCWIAAPPPNDYNIEQDGNYEGNKWVWISKTDEGKDEYGEDADYQKNLETHFYRWLFYYAPLWLCIVFVTGTMLLVYRTVRQRELRTISESESEESIHSNRRHYSFIRRLSKKGGSRRPSEYSINEQQPQQSQQSQRQEWNEERTTVNKITTSPVIVTDMYVNSSSGVLISKPLNSSRKNEKESIDNREENRNNDNIANVLQTIASFATASQQAIETSSFCTHAVYKQAMYYTLAFYLTFISGTVNRLIQTFLGVTFFPIIFLQCVTQPLQGFFNGKYLFGLVVFSRYTVYCCFGLISKSSFYFPLRLFCILYKQSSFIDTTTTIA